MKQYSVATLNGFTKKELVEYIMNLYQWVNSEETLNTHMYLAVTAAMHKDVRISQGMSEVLETWNKYGAHRYIEYDKYNNIKTSLVENPKS